VVRDRRVIEPAWAREVERLAAAVAARWGLALVGLDVVGEGRRTILRMNVEGPEGVSVETCARISEELSRALDLHDPIPHAYTLEVSSPGLDRRLYKPADYERFRGRRVQVRLKQRREELGGRRFTAELEGLADGVVSFQLEDRTLRVPYDDIDRVNLVLEL